ncbi:MAG: response regulator [Chloroflexi bacterium]|nr:response regulator [Chloroflexota bacterium]
MRQEEKVRVLIAEDDYLASKMIEEAVKSIGFVVVGEAMNGQEAVDMTASLRPDIVLMDINMPDMDGLEATRLIQERCPTPVVVLTAYQTRELVGLAASAGVGAYLVKPPDAAQVQRAVTMAMARFADMMELRRLNAELQEALGMVKKLSGLLPICANCKKIRDEEGNWQVLEKYIEDHSEAEFSHGICPDCGMQLYPQYFKNRKKKEGGGQ